jgi:hypothetical protein
VTYLVYLPQYACCKYQEGRVRSFCHCWILNFSTLLWT